MSRRFRPRRPAALRRAQHGISLIFALMALVVLGLAAVALTRSVDTSVLVMGNLSFKQDAVVASSSAAEQAIGWIEANLSGSTLDSNDAAKGYYAMSLDNLDPTGNKTSAEDKRRLVKWDNDCGGAADGTYSTCDILPFTGADVNGNKVQWVITRLCDLEGAPSTTNTCLRPLSSGAAETAQRDELTGKRITSGMSSPYFRVIVRVEGPRNTVSFTETLVHF